MDPKPTGGEGEEESELGTIRQTLSQFSGLSFSVLTFLAERIEETIFGYTASTVVNIYGTNLDQLDREAGEITRVLRGMPLSRMPKPGLPRRCIWLLVIMCSSPELRLHRVNLAAT